MILRIRPGKYLAYNQGRNITPHNEDIEVVWANSVDVWYKKNDGIVHQTPVQRFKEIIRWTNETSSKSK